MSTWKDRWGHRPAELVAKATKAVSGAVKPAKPRERTGGYWPDDDLEELEHPRKGGWLGPKRVKDWLRR